MSDSTDNVVESENMYFQRSIHAKSFVLKQGTYILFSPTIVLDIDTWESIMVAYNLLVFALPPNMEVVNGYTDGKLHHSFPIADKMLTLMPLEMLTSVSLELQNEIGIKIIILNDTVCYEHPDSIVIDDYTLYKESDSAFIQENNAEWEEPQEELQNERHEDFEHDGECVDVNEEEEGMKFCPVCYGGEQYLMTYPCGHNICYYCLREEMKRRNKCPTCRRNMVSDSQEEGAEYVGSNAESSITVSSIQDIRDEQVWIASAYERLKAMSLRQQREYVCRLCETMREPYTMDDFGRGGRFGTFALRLGYVVNQEE